MDIFSLYKKASGIHSVTLAIGSLPITRTALKSIGVKKGSITEKVILFGVVVVIGKVIFDKG